MSTFAYAARRAVRRLRQRGVVDVVLGFNHSIEQDVYRLGGGTHAAYLEMAEGTSRTPLLDKVALRLEQARFTPGAFVSLVAPSQQVKAEVLAHYPVPEAAVHVIYNGVDLERFMPQPELRAARRAALGLPAEAKVAIFVGQELQRKGFGAAVEACAQLGAQLVYLGQARAPSDLPPHVIWLGERRDVEAVMGAADALVLPSHYDPFGGVVLEAYACGLPAVATRRVGATELAVGTALDELLISRPQAQGELQEALARALTGGPAFYGAQARKVAESRGLQAFGRDLLQVLMCAAPRGRAGPGKDPKNSSL